MPQIPRYSQQAGGVVQFPTARLTGLDSGVFEQAALSQAGATQDVLGAVSDVAAKFEAKRQEAEFYNLEQTFRERINAETFDLVTSDTSQTVDEWLPKSQEYKQKLSADIDAVKGISGKLKSRLKNGMLGLADSRLYDGKKNSFDRDIANKSEIANKNILSLVQDAADVDGQELETPQGRISKSEVILADAISIIQRGQDLGYALDYDERGLRFAVDEEVINRKLQADDLPLRDYVELEQQILLGEGRYEKYDMAERRNLASEVSGHISRMETIRTREIQVEAQDNLLVMSRAMPDVDENGVIIMDAPDKMERLAERNMSLANELERMGDVVGAEKLRDDTRLAAELFAFNDEIAFKSDDYIADRVSEFQEAVDVASGVSIAAEADAIEVLNNVQTLVQERNQKLNEDPADYVRKQNLRVSSQPLSYAGIAKIQNEMGMSEQSIQVLTNAELEQLQEDVNSGDINAAFDSIAGFFNQPAMQETVTIDGEEIKVGDLAMRQARASGLSMGLNIVASNPNHRQAKNMLVTARMDTKTFNEMTEQVTDDDKNDIRNEVTQEMSQYLDSVVGDFDGGTVDQTGMGGRAYAMFELTDEVTKQAIYLVSRGMDVNNAVAAATSIINDKYAFIDADYAYALNAPVRVPVKYNQGDNLANWNKFLYKYTETQLGQRNVVLPNDWETRFDSEKAATEFYASRVFEHGRWVTSDDDSGVYLVDEYGNPVEETNSQGVNVRVAFTWDSMSKAIEKMKKNPDMMNDFFGGTMDEFGVPVITGF